MSRLQTRKFRTVCEEKICTNLMLKDINEEVTIYSIGYKRSRWIVESINCRVYGNLVEFWLLHQSILLWCYQITYQSSKVKFLMFSIDHVLVFICTTFSSLFTDQKSIFVFLQVDTNLMSPDDFVHDGVPGIGDSYNVAPYSSILLKAKI